MTMEELTKTITNVNNDIASFGGIAPNIIKTPLKEPSS